MSLRVTRCPQCNSTFNTNAQIRSVASGLVRCGACLFVFKAQDHFTEAAEESENTENPAEVFLSAETDFFNPSHFLRRNELSTADEEHPPSDSAAPTSSEDLATEDNDSTHVGLEEFSEPVGATEDREEQPPGTSSTLPVEDSPREEASVDEEVPVASTKETPIESEPLQADYENRIVASAADLPEVTFADPDLEQDSIGESIAHPDTPAFDAIDELPERAAVASTETAAQTDNHALFDHVIEQAFHPVPETEADTDEDVVAEGFAEPAAQSDIDDLVDPTDSFSFQVVDSPEDGAHSAIEQPEDREEAIHDEQQDRSWEDEQQEFDVPATALSNPNDSLTAVAEEDSPTTSSTTIAEIDIEAVRLDPLPGAAAERADQDALAVQEFEETEEEGKPQPALDDWDEEQALEVLSEQQLAALNTVGEAVRIAQGQRSRTGRNILIAMTVILAIGLVLGLLMWQRMPSLSQSNQFRPYYVTVCGIVGCDLPAFSNVGEIRSDSLQVSSHPEIENALLFTIVFRNQAQFPQPFPVLNLSFSDFNQRPIAQRDFRPAEYLPEDLRHIELMPVSTPIQVSLELVDPGDDAINYNIAFSPP